MENKKVCRDCGCVIDQDNEVIEIDNEYLCQSCYENNYFVCHDCGTIHPMDEEYWVQSEQYSICEDCYSYDYFTCGDCGEICSNDNGYYVSDREEYICSDCRYNCDYYECHDCSELFYVDSLTYIQNEDYDVCERCYENSDYHYCDGCGNNFRGETHYEDYECYCSDCYNEGNSNMLSYHQRVDWQFFRTEKDQPIEMNGTQYTMYIGTEIEQEPNGSSDVSGVIKAINNNINGVGMYDGSLNSGGVEIITHPQTWNYFQEHKQDYVKLFNELNNLNYKNCGHCGLHFHISKPDNDTIARAIVLLESFKSEIKTLSRRNQDRLNQWARFITDSCYEEDKLKYQSQKFIKEDYLNKYHDRYMALNLSNLKTIEFRFFAGVNNFEEFWSALQFINNLMQIALNHDKDINKVKWKDLLVGEELIEFASKRGLLEIDKSARDTTEILEKLEELKLKTKEDIKKTLKNMIVYMNRQMKKLEFETTTSKDVAEIQKETTELFTKVRNSWQSLDNVIAFYNCLDNMSIGEVRNRIPMGTFEKYPRYYKQILKTIEFYKKESEVVA